MAQQHDKNELAIVDLTSFDRGEQLLTETSVPAALVLDTINIGGKSDRFTPSRVTAFCPDDPSAVTAFDELFQRNAIVEHDGDRFWLDFDPPVQSSIPGTVVTGLDITVSGLGQWLGLSLTRNIDIAQDIVAHTKPRGSTGTDVRLYTLHQAVVEHGLHRVLCSVYRQDPAERNYSTRDVWMSIRSMDTQTTIFEGYPRVHPSARYIKSRHGHSSVEARTSHHGPPHHRSLFGFLQYTNEYTFTTLAQSGAGDAGADDQSSNDLRVGLAETSAPEEVSNALRRNSESDHEGDRDTDEDGPSSLPREPSCYYQEPTTQPHYSLRNGSRADG